MTIHRYLHAAARTFDVPVPVILGATRDKRAVNARRAVAVLSRENLGRSFPQIGKVMNRDHSTIIYTYRRGIEQRATDQDFADRCAVIATFQQVGDVLR